MVGVYKITSPTNKIYVGQSINISKRKKEYENLNCKKQIKLYNSLQKYGFENHVFEIIEECYVEQLNEHEIYWINFYNSTREGLNIREGGSNGALSEETKQKMRKPKREGTGEKISKNSKGISRNKGRKQSEQEKEKRSQIKKGTKLSSLHIENIKKNKLNKNTKSILCINDQKEFSSIKIAAEYYKLNTASIDNILSGRAFSTRKDKLRFKYINNN
jgi:group I intron endonuclease